MGILTEWITEWLKGLLIEGIMGNLEGLFDTVNTRVGEISVEPWITPAELAITLCDTSKIALTILNVLERIRMAAAVLKIHLKKIQ